MNYFKLPSGRVFSSSVNNKNIPTATEAEFNAASAEADKLLIKSINASIAERKQALIESGFTGKQVTALASDEISELVDHDH